MTRIRSSVTLTALLLLCVTIGKAEPRGSDSSPKIVLKLDDMKHRNGELAEGWKRTLAYLDEQGIPASIGLICNSLDGAPASYVETLKALQRSGRYELWNHGWSHTRDREAGTCEFDGTGYAYQAERFERSQRLALDALGFALIGFGAPFNATDADTSRVLGETPGIRWWMYPPEDTTIPDGVLPLPRVGRVNIEKPVHVPNPAALREAFPGFRDRAVLVIQGHPAGWDQKDHLANFEAIIDYLREEGCTFVLPRDLLLTADADARVPG